MGSIPARGAFSKQSQRVRDSLFTGSEVQSDYAMVTWAVIVFALLTGLVTAFQIALLFGAPWGELTLGGKYQGTLPGRARLIPLVSAILLIGFAVIVVSRAGLAFPGLRGASTYLVWVVVVYCALGCVANAITPSRRERRLWLPVVFLLLVTSVVVALS